jgi:flagellar motor switch protein FliG
MSMLARYKKQGGFEQLLLLLETSNIKKQEQFLKLIEAENPSTAHLLKSKILTLDKILSWDASFLGDITAQIPPKILAAVLKGQKDEVIQKCIATFPHGKKQEILQILKDSNVTPGEIETAKMKMISTVRELNRNKIIKLEKVAPDMDITDLKIA